MIQFKSEIVLKDFPYRQFTHFSFKRNFFTYALMLYFRIPMIISADRMREYLHYLSHILLVYHVYIVSGNK